MIEWLRAITHRSSREHYEEQVRHDQQENVKRFAEERRRDIDQRLQYLEAVASALARGSNDATG